MATDKFEIPFATPEMPQKHILGVYEYPNFGRDPATHHEDVIGGDGFRVEAVAADDYRVEAARAMEIKAMAALGDEPEEVYAEFLPYNDFSIYFLAFDKGSNGDDVTDIAAMGRIIPYDPSRSNKTLLDLAIIPGWDAKNIPKVPALLDDGQNETVIHDTESVVGAFCEEAGCSDITKVWDIATMAPDLDKVIAGQLNAPRVAKSILAAASEYGIEQYIAGNLTHITSFNQEHAHDFFVKVGYPFKPMFGLAPMVYDSFGTGSGMKAQPAWFEAGEFVAKIEGAARLEPASYLGVIGTRLARRGILQQ